MQTNAPGRRTFTSIAGSGGATERIGDPMDSSKTMQLSPRS
jgi:hypothetical protein